MTQGQRRRSGIEAVLFDMDGTLVDTDEHWHAAEVATFAHYDVPWTDHDHAALLGVPVVPATQYMLEKLGGARTFEEVSTRMMDNLIARLHANDIAWRPGARELLARLHDCGIATALVTASRMPLVEGVFHDVHALGFDTVVTGDDVAVTKPHPAPYLLALERLGRTAATSVACEDSKTGVRAARAAGLTVIAIPHLVALDPEPGVVAVSDLLEVDIAFLDALVGVTG
jgi:HAD superfamily hydrolase (TIGR01509 family)